jgi:hypothetical protein
MIDSSNFSGSFGVLISALAIVPLKETNNTVLIEET